MDQLPHVGDLHSQMKKVSSICGTPAQELVNAKPNELREVLIKLKTKLKRERRKGVANHFRYDLNRHIALKQACDLIEGRLAPH